MPKVLITGSSGVGKSTIIDNLHGRGYVAYDTDDIPGATSLIHIPTGQPIDWPKHGPMDWRNTYAWNWQEPVFSNLLKSSETVFIGAVVGNWRNYINEFDHIIVLGISPDEQRHRLLKRTTHKHGNDIAEINQRVERQIRARQPYLDAGAKLLMNDTSIDAVVDKLIEMVKIPSRARH